jgi:hypothetical protein
MAQLNTDQAATRHARLSRRCAVDVTIGSGGMVVEWAPRCPDRLTRQEWDRYVEARNACASDFAGRIGGPIVIAGYQFYGGPARPLAFYPDGRIEPL